MNSSNIQVKNKHQTMKLDPVMPILNLFTTNGFETTTSTFVVTIYNDSSIELTGPVPEIFTGRLNSETYMRKFSYFLFDFQNNTNCEK